MTVHKPHPLDAHEDTWQCSCGKVFIVKAGYVLCPDREVNNDTDNR